MFVTVLRKAMEDFFSHLTVQLSFIHGLTEGTGLSEDLHRDSSAIEQNYAFITF